eukprot:gene11787-biopygen8762
MGAAQGASQGACQGGSDWRVRGASAFRAGAPGKGHRRVAELEKLMLPAGTGWERQTVCACVRASVRVSVRNALYKAVWTDTRTHAWTHAQTICLCQFGEASVALASQELRAALLGRGASVACPFSELPRNR